MKLICGNFYRFWLFSHVIIALKPAERQDLSAPLFPCSGSLALTHIVVFASNSGYCRVSKLFVGHRGLKSRIQYLPHASQLYS